MDKLLSGFEDGVFPTKDAGLTYMNNFLKQVKFLSQSLFIFDIIFPGRNCKEILSGFPLLGGKFNYYEVLRHPVCMGRGVRDSVDSFTFENIFLENYI